VSQRSELHDAHVLLPMYAYVLTYVTSATLTSATETVACRQSGVVDLLKCLLTTDRISIANEHAWMLHVRQLMLNLRRELELQLTEMATRT
jgi:hypothetical protein